VKPFRAEDTRIASRKEEQEKEASTQGGVVSTNSDDLKQEVEDLKTAQATQTATQAGAQATQAATQAGTMSTMTASQAGMMAAGFVGLIVGIFLGLAIANSK
jgi:hypothetical protein